MSAKHLPHELNPCACGGKPYPLIRSGVARSSLPRELRGLWFRGAVKCKACGKRTTEMKSPFKMAQAWNRMNPRTDADGA